MNWSLIEGIIADGVPLVGLVVIPLVAMIGAIVIGVGVYLRRGTVITAAIMAAVVTGATALAIDGTGAAFADAPGSIYALAPVLPVALAIGAVLGGLPALSRGMFALIGVAHRLAPGADSFGVPENGTPASVIRTSVPVVRTSDEAVPVPVAV